MASVTTYNPQTGQYEQTYASAPKNPSVANQIATGARDIAYDVTGADNYMQSFRDFKRGNIVGGFFNLLQGAGETAMLFTPGLGKARVGALVAKGGAKKLVGQGSKLLGGGFGRGGARGFGGGLALNVGSRGVFPGSPTSQYYGVQGPTTGGDPYANVPAMPTDTVVNRGSGGGGKGGGKKGKKPKYESTLPGISPEDLQRIQQARGTAAADYEALMNQLNMIDRQSSAETQAGMMAAGRQGTGQRQDLESYLTESGYSMAPAQLDVGVESIRAQEAAARSGVAGRRSGVLQDTNARRTTGRRTLADALMSLAALEGSGRVGASLEGLNRF